MLPDGLCWRHFQRRAMAVKAKAFGYPIEMFEPDAHKAVRARQTELHAALQRAIAIFKGLGAGLDLEEAQALA